MCPECGSRDVELMSSGDDGQGYYEEQDYVCERCGCEWTWTMTKKVTKHGREESET